MRILLLTDQSPESIHSAIQGIFNRHLRKHAEIRIVRFARGTRHPQHGEGQSILPWRYRKWPLLWKLFPPFNLDDYEVVIVRNLFRLLGVLTRPDRIYRLGFWESFPHSYRRFHEASLTGQALWRKRLEYAWRQRRERALLSRCDFYLPITETFRKRFRKEVEIPTHPLPMGVDAQELPPVGASTRHAHNGTLKMLYVGAVDALRGFDILMPALRHSTVPYALDIYTPSRNDTTASMQRAADPRIRLHAAIPRQDLLSRMPEYDIGLSLIPSNPLYDVASPTKTMEYYAMGLPALMTPLPEHLALFDETNGFFSPLAEEEVAKQLAVIYAQDRESLIRRGQLGRKRVLKMRSYEVMARELHEFLEQVISGHTASHRHPDEIKQTHS